MVKKYVVLKHNGPMRLANATFKIKQGQIVMKPPFPIDPEVLDVFDGPDEKQNLADAREAAIKNVRLKNIATREGITNTKTLAKLLAKEAKGPSEADRETARKNANIVTPDGVVDPNMVKENPPLVEKDLELEELKAHTKKLEAELEKLKQKSEKVNSQAYLDQNSRTAVKSVRKAAKKGQLKKKDVNDIIQAEEAGLKRKTVLEKLKNLAKDDVIFGKLFK